MKLSRLTLVALVVLGCGPSKDNESAEGGDSLEETHGHSSSQSGTATGGATMGPTTPPDPTTTVTTGGPTGEPTTETTTPTTPTTADSPEVTTSAGTGGGECMVELPGPDACKPFIFAPDLGDVFQCDSFQQTCGEGEKCNAWSSDGDGSWDATKCVPIAPNPDQVGDPCTAEGGGVSGVDSCRNGAMCWNVDAKTGIGTCVEQCSCEPALPTCATPNTACMITNGGVLALCMPVCDPLDPGSCAGGEVCVANPVEGRPFICVPDGSGGAGQVGDPCESADACDPALVCGDPALLPGLCDAQSAGCCLPYCDLSAADCPQGTSCLPFSEPGKAPKCFESVGVCGAADGP